MRGCAFGLETTLTRLAALFRNREEIAEIAVGRRKPCPTSLGSASCEARSLAVAFVSGCQHPWAGTWEGLSGGGFGYCGVKGQEFVHTGHGEEALDSGIRACGP